MLALTGTAVATVAAAPAHADGCYTWSRNLSRDAKGADVVQLQIRVAGWAGYNVLLDLDGDYGPKTETAVRNFQAAYGLKVDGKAGPETFSKIYALQDDDCTPVHFTIAEASDNCGKGAAGMPATVRTNLIRALWRAEAVRQRLGHALNINSGWRDAACNASVGGATNSDHLTGNALDLDVDSAGSYGLCDIARAARYSSFGQILGPGYPKHNDHIHVSVQSTLSRQAPNCSGF
jgi:zinc D-Ala-D-Ala carboxypeptidase